MITALFLIFDAFLCVNIDGIDGDTKSVARRPSRKEGETGAVPGEKSTPTDTTSQ